MKPISMIVAVAEGNVIGKENRLLWHLPKDLKRFRNITENHKIIMGKKTFDSLPKGPLPHRTNIILSKSVFQLDSCIVVDSIEGVLELCDDNQENFIIGGASVYEQFLPLSQKLYYTKVYANFDGDTFFPVLNNSEWKLIDREFHDKDEKHLYAFEFITFVRT